MIATKARRHKGLSPLVLLCVLASWWLFSQEVKINMDENKKEIIAQELTLILIYLTGWEEDERNSPGKKVFRAWKGYRFEVLDALQSQGLIRQVPGGKSLLLYEKGKEKVRELIKKYIEGNEKSQS